MLRVPDRRELCRVRGTAVLLGTVWFGASRGLTTCVRLPSFCCLSKFPFEPAAAFPATSPFFMTKFQGRAAPFSCSPSTNCPGLKPGQDRGRGWFPVMPKPSSSPPTDSNQENKKVIGVPEDSLKAPGGGRMLEGGLRM